MTHADILAELPTLSADERQDLLNRLCELQGSDMAAGRGPTEDLKKILDEELDEYERTKDSGTPWEDFISEFRVRSTS